MKLSIPIHKLFVNFKKDACQMRFCGCFGLRPRFTKPMRKVCISILDNMICMKWICRRLLSFPCQLHFSVHKNSKALNLYWENSSGIFFYIHYGFQRSIPFFYLWLLFHTSSISYLYVVTCPKVAINPREIKNRYTICYLEIHKWTIIPNSALNSIL